jgi:hypothetical protein
MRMVHTNGSLAGRFLTRTPTRIAIAGDWHANTDHAVEAILHAGRRHADVLVHLGDFGYNFTGAYLDALESALASQDLVLGFVEGNHENFDWLLSQPTAPDGLRPVRERIVHLPRGLRWQWGTVRALAVGGAYSLDQFLRVEHKSWWPQELITGDDVRSIGDAGPADVMFCHDCPAGISVPTMQRRTRGYPDVVVQESERNRVRLRAIVDQVRPRRLWHGHFHHRYQSLLDGGDYRTVVDGLGRDKDPIDNNLVVVNLDDLARHSAASDVLAR